MSLITLTSHTDLLKVTQFIFKLYLLLCSVSIMRKLPLLWINHSKFISLIRHNICICFPYGNLWLNPELFTFRVCGGLLFAHGGGLYSQSHWKPRHDCSVHKVFDFVRLHWLNFSAFYLITENQYVHGQLFFIIFCKIYCHYAHMTYADLECDVQTNCGSF